MPSQLLATCTCFSKGVRFSQAKTEVENFELPITTKGSYCKLFSVAQFSLEPLPLICISFH